MSTRALTLAGVNDYEVVVRGLSAMLGHYRDRVHVVELDATTTVGTPVDLALYDSFAATQGDRQDVHDLAQHPLVDKLVVYSSNLNDELITAALANGASGYVAKSLPAQHLVAALEDIHHDGPRVHLGPGSARGDWPGREEGLSPREAEILALITQGLTNDEIADRAQLSINSVKTHIRSCYRRISITSRSQAVLWGIEHGFRPDRLRLRPTTDRPPHDT